MKKAPLTRGLETKTSAPILPAAGTCLTPGQQHALDLLLPIFQGHQPGARASLQGYAGTGKTFLSARLVAAALDSIPGARGASSPWGGWKTPPTVVLASPTHKACRQMERALASYGIEGIEAVTLHSALGLRPQRDEDRETFIADPRALKLIGPATQLVVVDEASMVGRRLVELLLAALPRDAALVAIGDPAQLQPVGDPRRSPLFNLPIQAQLAEVVRHQGPILELATATRELGRGRPHFEAMVSDESAVITHPHFGAWRLAAIRACCRAAREGNTDGARVLAWTNAAGVKFNTDVHRAIYGAEAPPFVVGQPVVSHGVIAGPDGKPLVSSTCEMTLLAVERCEGRVAGDELLEVREALLLKRRTKAGEQLPPWTWWAIEARITGQDSTIRFEVLEPSCQAAWRKAANAIAKAAKGLSATHGKAAAASIWQLFWRRKEGFGEISPVWAMTVHKAQGSTFERVFIHPDLGRHPDLGEQNQLAYVAITRASRELHLVADPPPPAAATTSTTTTSTTHREVQR